jgi:molybdenum cofactor biosynthesis enzyme MoaA
LKAVDKFQIATIRKKTINAKYLVILAKYSDTMQQLIQLIEKEKLGNQPAKQYTLIIDDKQVVHGALFVIKTTKKHLN